MEIFTYTIMFIIGIFFGSFFTLAVYRIPRGENILYKHSYCPSCNNKLQLLDLFPVFSYLFLKGKCRHCGEKIRIRYLLLELLSGSVFVLYAISIKMNFLNINFRVEYIAIILQILNLAGLFIIAGIDKERKNIQKSVLFYETIVALIYMIYVCTLSNANVYKYVIYLLVLLTLVVISTILLKKKTKTYYLLENAILLICMLILNDFIVTYYTLNLTLILICTYLLLLKIKQLRYKFKKEDNKKNIQIPIGFVLVVSNIVSVIIINFITNF